LFAAELTGRELLFSNTIALMVCMYSAAGHFASAVTGSVRFSIGTAAKRAIDIIGASLGLMILSPIFLIIAIAIKFDSEGPVFFTQLRVGLNRRSCGRHGKGRLTVVPRGRDRRRSDCYGRPFNVIKFRSMVEGAERKSGPIWATRNDPRITRVGSFLRKTRVDELPQLINVLLGHMSLVGPRPERPVFVESLTRDIEEYPGRLAVKPGITGLAQITNGYDTSVSSVREKVKHDLQYIADWTLVQDLKILLRTVLVVVTGKGAF
jgi:lipopolysaccharide/colanic/teichoic acid biosynthesis glycosyltransferase